MPLRKALLFATAVTDNAASFVNVTSKRLHIRKLVGNIIGSINDSLGETNTMSIDEVPVDQSKTNDSRSHIMVVGSSVTGGTGAISFNSRKQTLSFNRNDLVLDPDEAIFMNNDARVGSAASVLHSLNVWYED